MKVINICDSDWSNFAYDNLMALRSAGVNCVGVKLQDHVFAYENCLPTLPLEHMQALIKDYDVIQFFHDNLTLFRELLPAMEGKKIIVYHTTSYYRKHYATVNSIMNPHVYRSVCAMPEFMGKGAANEVYMVGAVNTEKLALINSPFVLRASINRLGVSFAHYPSNPNVKGSKKINELMSQIHAPNASYSYSGDLVPYHVQLERMSECDVYIEMFTDKDGNGMPYGNFGITALEAAALGKLVITCCKGVYHYLQAYGKPFFYIADDEKMFKQLIETISSASPEKIIELQAQKRELLVRYHSYRATGEYFLKHVR